MTFKQCQDRIIDPVLKRYSELYEAAGFNVSLKSVPDDISSLAVEISRESHHWSFGLVYSWVRDYPHKVEKLSHAVKRTISQQTPEVSQGISTITELTVEKDLEKLVELSGTLL